MTILQDTTTALPTGTWTLDPVHSRIEFDIAHNGISPFRGGFRQIEGSLDASGLAGTAQVASIALDDPDLRGHLLSPEFFDAERFPELSFRSQAIRVDGSALDIEGEITIRGVTRPVRLTGTVEGPVQNPFGGTVLALQVEGVLDRREFGMDWNMELPGGGEYLGNEVGLTAALELKREE
jgi:polyisoprenoid-binding protein YceI